MPILSNSVTNKELLEIVEKEKKAHEKELIDNLDRY